MKKVLVIVGPTASGKSALAVRLALRLRSGLTKKFKGAEIISADSRQVYRDLNIGTGKVSKKEMGGIPHHLLDVASPKKQFTVSDFLKKATETIGMIYHTNHLPIVVGGTGFYIDALTGKTSLPEVPPNKKLRVRLEKKSLKELFKILKKKDPKRAETIDHKNKVRLIRALEIIEALGHVPPPSTKHLSPRTYIYIGLKPDDLDKRIYKRLIDRLPGIIREVRKLRKNGLSWKRLDDLGLEYRYVSMYVHGYLPKKEMVEKLNIAIRQYAKRQMTWFKRNKEIEWFTLSAVEGLSQKKYKEIEKYVKVATERSTKRRVQWPKKGT